MGRRRWRFAWSAIGLWVAAAVAGCGDEGAGARGAPSGSTAPGASAAPPSPGCPRLPELRARLPKLREEGKLDRAARVLARMAELCPERASEDSAVRLEVLTELGRVAEVETIAREVETRADASAEAKQAARRALEALAATKPPADARALRRRARELYLKATVEPDHTKARDLFLEAAAALPAAGPALYQAGRAAKRAGHEVEARRLFDRALSALERATSARPVLRTVPAREGLGRIGVGAYGRLAMAAMLDAVRVFDTIGWRPRFDHDIDQAVASLSADGTLVVMASAETLLSCSLLDASCTQGRAPAFVHALALDAKGERCAALVGPDEVITYDASTLEQRASWRSPEGKVTALAISPDGTLIGAGLASGRLLLVALDSGEIRARLAGHEDRISALAFDAAGKRIVSTDGGGIRLAAVDGSKSEEVGRWERSEESAPKAVAIAPHGRTAYLPRDTKVEIWSLEPQEPRATSFDLGGFNMGEQVAATHDRLFVGMRTFHPLPWVYHTYGVVPIPLEQLTAAKPGELPEPTASWGGGPLPSLALEGAAGTLVTANETCTLTAWDLAAGTFLRTTDALQMYRNCPGFVLSTDGKSVTGRDSSYKLARLDLRTGATSSVRDADVQQRLEPLPAGLPESAVYGVAGGSSVAWLDGKGHVQVGPLAGPWRSAGKLYRPKEQDYPDYRDPNPPIALSPSGLLAAYRSGAGEARIVDVASGTVVRTVARVGLSGLAFGPNDEAFVSWLDGSISVACVEPTRAAAPPAVADAAAPPPSSTSRASDAAPSPPHGSADPLVGKMPTGRCVERTIMAPGGGPLFAIAMVQDGALLAGAVDDGPIYLWSTRDGTLRAALHSVGTGGMATSPDGFAELFGPVESELVCFVGPFVFGPELCRERLVAEGLLAALLQGRSIEP